MGGSSFGKIFSISTFGESHGGGVGVVIDGCPPGLELKESDIQQELDRRRPGQSDLVSSRNEADQIRIFSGIFEGRTTGAPLMLMVMNADARSEDYEHLKDVYRPSHADYTYSEKFGFRDWRGGGRASARETLARVAAGAVARKFLKDRVGIEVLAYVDQVGSIKANVDREAVTSALIDASNIRCPDPVATEKMGEFIKCMREEGDTIGGSIVCLIKGVPVGLGEPVFDKLHADLAKGMLSINAAKGFEIGSGFDGVRLKGSEHNDEFVLNAEGQVTTRSNNSGGIIGGISSGQLIYFRVAFKAVSSISKEQQSVNVEGQSVKLRIQGRHDPCVLPRAVPIVEAMSSLVIVDHYLRNLASARGASRG